MYYSDEQKELLCLYIDDAFSSLDILVREQVKTVALNTMVPSSTDIKVSESVINYVQEHWSDKGNVVFSQMLPLMSKNALHNTYYDIIKLLKRSRMGIEFSCGESTRLAYGTNNGPITVTCHVDGGIDPYERQRVFSLICNQTGCAITKTGESDFQVVFSSTGTYKFKAISKEMGTGYNIASVEYTVAVAASINNPPSAISIAFSCGSSIRQPDEDEPVTVTANITGGVDPEGKGQTIVASFPNAANVTKVNDRQYTVKYNEPGTYIANVTSTDPTGKKAEGQTTLNVIKYSLAEVFVQTSCGSSLTLGTAPNVNKTITVTVSGGADPGGRAITYDVQCATAVSVTKVNDTTWNVVLGTAGIHVIQGFAIASNGYRAVKTATVQTKAATTSSGTSTGQFVGAKFDSGWTELVAGCYISEFTMSLSISSGHSSSNDYLVVLGKKTDGSVVILRDVFNNSNRFKPIAAGSELANAVYTRSNLASTVWRYTNDPYTLDDDIRCIRFICETPGHESCAKNAAVSFSMGYSYDPSL